MPDKMLKFVKIGQQNPPKREVLSRKEDFNEIYKEFIHDKAKIPYNTSFFKNKVIHNDLVILYFNKIMI